MSSSKRLFADFESMSEIEKTEFLKKINDALAPVREAEKLYQLIDGMDDKPIEEVWDVIERANPTPPAILFLMLNAKANAYEEIKKSKSLSFEQIRKKGVEANKKKSQDNHSEILKANNQLLNHPDSARWTLDQRARKLSLCGFKQVNGKPYSERTIKNIITGT